MRSYTSRRAGRTFNPPKLNITSMMDMFTIILIFLLFSFSSKPELAGLEKNMELPQSTAKTDYQESIKLILSRSTLKMGDRILARIDHDSIVGLDPKNLKSSDLYRELSTRAKTQAEMESEQTESLSILLLCDRRLPFKTINHITKTAALAGFPNFQLAVLKR
ncbi:MAG: biopolymer transporter ExbD [Desulfobacterales bacterium]|jgi:biopolymer transport protein ExbD|nr:biopolymer transporter ExbD [Desulfobacterales bacterium]MDX2512737.1 biopolymer transporter ExbD [Desulfobacterales bacterium]